jgi:hypothetical protein
MSHNPFHKCARHRAYDPVHLRNPGAKADEGTRAGGDFSTQSLRKLLAVSPARDRAIAGEVAMKATAPSRKQKESAAEPSPRSWRVAAAILALLVFLPADTTAQLPQPPTLPRPTAESGGVPTVAATPSLPMVSGELGLPEGRWAPPDTDEAIPLVAPGIPCSLPQVLQAASQRVKELTVNLDRFAAIERIEHREVDKKGHWRAPKERSFEYVVTVSEIRPGMVIAEEWRNGSSSTESFPTHLATLGMVALALVFHPNYVGEHDVTCEGLGQWRGRPAWQLRFQERPNRKFSDFGFRIRQHSFPAKLKGRAWFAVDTHELLRLETDLVEPLPKIRLYRNHLAVEYRPVQFPKRNLELWLPESAEMYLDFRGHRYRHRHSYRDFKLFSVDTREQINEPPQP